MIFLDTSAVIALADSSDENHTKAVTALTKLTNQGHSVLTHNYILVESAALLQSRIGLRSALAFLSDAAKFTVHWVTPRDHADAVTLLAERNRRGLSLVDCMSFTVMRNYGVGAASAYDADFEAEGFDVW
ncbi:MAG: PIN domain-containing protein [Chloroflexi bacterium]|nr:PIN domain-containing protein [Chloroflexota bacterium]